MKYTPHVLFALLITGLLSCHTSKQVTNVSDAPYQTLESGIKYKLLKDVKGKKHPKEGDFVKIFISTYFGDSMIFDSRSQSSEPVRFGVAKPRFHGDLSEVFPLMTPGDSGVFLVPVDTMVATGQKLQPWMKKGKDILYAIELVDVQTQEDVNKEMEEKARAKADPLAENMELQAYFKKHDLHPEKRPSGLYYLITKKTDGDKPLSGKTVYVNYTGKLMNGDVFDSNAGRDPLKFVLGRGQVILGWDEGIAQLRKGEKATLFIPSHLAYGENSPSPKIPPNSILIFDVELVDF